MRHRLALVGAEFRDPSAMIEPPRFRGVSFPMTTGGPSALRFQLSLPSCLAGGAKLIIDALQCLDHIVHLNQHLGLHLVAFLGHRSRCEHRIAGGSDMNKALAGREARAHDCRPHGERVLRPQPAPRAR